MKNKISKKIKKTMIFGSMIGISTTLIPICVVACGAGTSTTSNSSGQNNGNNNTNNGNNNTNNGNNNINALQTIANNAANEVKSLKSVEIINQTLPTEINSSNISEWFSTPENTKTNTFTLTIAQNPSNQPMINNFTGQVVLLLTLTSTLYPNSAAQANITFNDFLTYQKQADNLASAIKVTENSNINTIYPVQISTNNINSYLSITSLPSTISYLSYIYNFNNVDASTSSGQLNLSITIQNSFVDPTTHSTIQSTTMNFPLEGFKQGTVSSGATVAQASGATSLSQLVKNLRIVVPKGYSISQFMSAAISLNIKGTDGYWLPSNGLIGDVLFLNNSSNNWPVHDNWTLWTTQNNINSSNSTTLNSVNDDSINVLMYATKNASDGTLQIKVNGFDSVSQYLTPILNSQTITVNSTGKNQLPTTVNDTNINSYLNLPAAPSGVSSLQAILDKNSVGNNTNGSLQIILQATIYGVVVSSNPITVTGFQTTIQFTAQSIANNLASHMQQNVSLSKFINNEPINFTLADIPSWFNISEDNMTILKNLIGSISLSDVQINIALPTYNSNPPVGNLSSNTSSNITVTINGESASGILTNFQSAQNYFATSGIINATIANASQYANLNDLWTAIQKAGLTKDGETINANGSTTNSAGSESIGAQSIFDVTLNSKNIFNWKNSSITYLTCAIVDNTITLRIFINGNVWFDVNFTASDISTSAVKPTEPVVLVSSITKE